MKFLVVGIIALILAPLTLGGNTPASCTITPSVVTVGESFTIHAEGLPQVNVDLVQTFKDWKSAGPILTPNGIFDITFTTNDLYPQDTPGTFVFAFTNKNQTKTYTTCSVTLN